MSDELTLHDVLGETSAEIRISTVEQNRAAAISLASQARRSLDLFTPDLDAAVFNNEQFEKCLFNLATRNPNCFVRILVIDSAKAIHEGHRLVRLAQDLTSSVFIHNPAKEDHSEYGAFLLADSIGVLYRETNSRRDYNALVNFNEPARCAILEEFFTETWNRSTPDPQVKRLYI